MEIDEPPGPKIEEVFISCNNEHDYAKINGYKLCLCQLIERKKLYEESLRPLGSFSELMYCLYSEAIDEIWKKRFERGLYGIYSNNPNIDRDKRLKLKRLTS